MRMKELSEVVRAIQEFDKFGADCEAREYTDVADLHSHAVTLRDNLIFVLREYGVGSLVDGLIGDEVPQ